MGFRKGDIKSPLWPCLALCHFLPGIKTNFVGHQHVAPEVHDVLLGEYVREFVRTVICHAIVGTDAFVCDDETYRINIMKIGCHDVVSHDLPSVSERLTVRISAFSYVGVSEKHLPVLWFDFVRPHDVWKHYAFHQV